MESASIDSKWGKDSVGDTGNAVNMPTVCVCVEFSENGLK